MKYLIALLSLVLTFAVAGGSVAADSCAECPSATACAKAGTDEACEAEGTAFRNFYCPVTGEPAMKGIVAEHDGILYNFNTEDARDEFVEDPEAYLDELPNGGEIVDMLNEYCPVTGQPARKELWEVVNGEKIHVTSSKAKLFVARVPKKFYDSAKANADLTPEQIKFKYSKTPRYNNSTCPVTGDAVNKSYIVVHNDIAYYVSTPEAQDKLNENPEKYLSKLPNNGEIIDMGNYFCPMKLERLEGTKLAVTVEGHKIYAGCRGCAMAILKDPEKYIAKVEKLMAMPEEERDKLIQPAGSCEGEEEEHEG